MSKLSFNEIIKNAKIISSEESLKDIVPINWSEEVLSGNKKVLASDIERNSKDKCVKLEISNCS